MLLLLQHYIVLLLRIVLYTTDSNITFLRSLPLLEQVITRQNVLLQFPTSQAIRNYENVLFSFYSNLRSAIKLFEKQITAITQHYNLRQLLELKTTVITIYDRCYNPRCYYISIRTQRTLIKDAFFKKSPIFSKFAAQVELVLLILFKSIGSVSSLTYSIPYQLYFYIQSLQFFYPVLSQVQLARKLRTVDSR